MHISVVIAGNIGPSIEETIVAVPAAVLQEVIVVDEASRDGTVAEIKTLLGRHHVLHVITDPQDKVRRCTMV